jgi:hypothetical protein
VLKYKFLSILFALLLLLSIFPVFSFFTPVLMKKFLAFLLAFLIVVGIYLLMKKQSQPDTQLPGSVKNILGLEQPQPSDSNEKNQPTVLLNPEVEQEELIVDAPKGDTTHTWKNEQPAVIPSQEAVQATSAVAPLPATDNWQPTDDGLSPLQKAIKAKRDAGN